MSDADCTSMRRTPRGVGKRHRPCHQRDLRTRLLRRTGNGKTHFAAGPVGDATHRVDGFKGRARP
jgi:hypothetical protein